MSDVPKPVEDTPAPAAESTPVADATEAAKPSEATAESEPSAAVKPNEAEAAAVGSDAGPAPPKDETPKDSEAKAESTPASEGLLGYKAPGILPKFRFHEHYFWFDDAPSTPESLNAYVRSKDLKSAHPNAAWAQETGKGLLFYAKRVEDKATPAGIINLSEATSVLIEGMEEFFFKAHGDKHTFKAKNSEERSGWVAALEKKIEEAKAMKDEIQGSEGYKKHLESFAKTPALGAATTAATSTSREQKKSLDTASATNGTNKNPTDAEGTPEEKKEKDTKSRSQSRKRSSIFGSLLGKKDEKDEQKEVKKEEKAEDKAEKKAEKEEGKEEKKEEAEEAATAAAATGAATTAAEEKKDDKHERQTTPTTEKKPKRGSIWGGLFSKKDATNPTSEKAEKEAGPSVPAKDAEVLPVSETAPKIEEPIANKPIDPAAVTAPIDTAQTPAAAADETPTETAKETAPAEAATTPTKEKKSGFLSYIKKEAAGFGGKKEVKKDETAEKKEEEAAESASKDPVAAAATTTTESPANVEEAAAPAAEESKPHDKRRSSLFNLGGTIKKRTHNAESADAEAADAGTKREKSPLPQRIGSLFRRPSRGVKSEEPKDATAAGADSPPAVPTASAAKDEAAVTTGSSTEAPSSAVAGDVVPDALHSNFPGAATAPEVKASA